MKVQATKRFKKVGVRPRELEFIPEPLQKFELSDERAKELEGLGYVIILDENKVETKIKEVKKEKATKNYAKK